MTYGNGLLHGAVHPFVGIDHLLVMLAVGLVAAVAPAGSAAWRVPAGFVAGAAVGGVLALAGLGLPAVEVVIAASVVAIGVPVASRRLSGAVWLPVLAGAFAVFHGHAHGTEIPTSAEPAAYVAGFLLATAALHALGTAAGLRLRCLPVVRIATGAGIGAVGVVLLVAH